MEASRIEEDALRGRGLSGVDVRHDPDVPEPLETRAALYLPYCHRCDFRISSDNYS
jgi:hypothetical protein